jgi:putative endonuclease
MAKTSKQTIGTWGENLAASFLQEKDFDILEKNWRWKRAEIDLIAMDQKTLVFIEVKVRANPNFGNPEDFVGKAKSTLIKNASTEYQISKKFEGFIRFDIVSIIGNQNKFEILHLRDAF